MARPTVSRGIRLPTAVWEAIDWQARVQGIKPGALAGQILTTAISRAPENRNPANYDQIPVKTTDAREELPALR